MSSTGSAVAQRTPAPRNGESSYSSRQQPAKNQPDLSGRLIYADPRSLPSFPSVGVKLDSTNTAALMASTSKSPPPIFDVTGPTNPASLKAATTAAAASAALKSIKSANVKPALTTDAPEALQSKNMNQASPTSSNGPREPLPSHLAAGVKAPATASSSDMPPKSSGASTTGWGNSAATQAFRNSQILSAKRASAPPEKPIPEILALGQQPSLRAAKDAMKTASNPNRTSVVATSPSAASATLSNDASASGIAAAGATGAVSGNASKARTRHRAQTTPLSLRQQKSFLSQYPDSVTLSNLNGTPPDPKVSAANALSAATVAHTKSQSGGDRRSYVGDAGAVPYTNMNRQMYTSNPPIGPEFDTQKHQDGLHASAVAMAKQMYNPNAEGGVTSVKVPNVQEQAYRLAQERLDKIYEQHAKDRDFRDHYVDAKMGTDFGAGNTSHRLSMRSRLRRHRSSSDSDVDLDRMRSMEIRNQMSLLSNRISEVSQDKRRQDRQSVLLAAQRNVKLQLQNIDEQVYANSGRLPPSVTSTLDQAKINTIAQARADAQIGTYPRSDQVDIGGGKFMDRAEIDKIASRRMQPVIDDMHAKAQQEIERKAKLREEEEQRKAQLRQKEEDRKAEAAILKARDKEMKELYRQLKKDEKLRKAEEKAAEKEGKKSGRNTGTAKEDISSEEEGKIEKVDSNRMTAHGTSGASTQVSSPEVSKTESSKTNGQLPGAHSETSPNMSPASAARPTVPLVAASAESVGASNAFSTAATTPAKSMEAQPSSDPAPDRKSTIDDRQEVFAERADGSSAGRKLSKLFVKTPKEKTGGSRSESNGNAPGKIPGSAVAGAAGALGAGAMAEAKPSVSDTNDVRPSTALADKASTPQSPMSPLSDNESSSPNSKKVKSWFKSHFSRDRSKSSASATGAPSATVLGKTAPTSGAAATGHSASSPSKAVESTTVPDYQSHTEKSFVGGHALTGAESHSPQGRGSGPTVGSTSLAATLMSGGAIATAGSTAAASITSDKDAASNIGQETNVQRDSAATIPERSFTPTGSDRRSRLDQPSSPSVGTGENTTSGGPQQATATEITDTEPAGIAATKDVYEEQAATSAQQLSSPGQISTSQSDATTNLGLASPTADASGTAGASLDKGLNSEHTIPGNRASYTSSQYSADASVTGVTGSGFGLVGANIFANVSSMVPAEKRGDGNTFVSVLPPASTAIATNTESGELTPPMAIRDPAKKKSASPVRDSRFLENLEELP
ncbi:Eisosome assembly protein [Sporothrix epigloea]|uniref:Eisosome assembly protein n=1 Tax=Sporothrix epigloea TaxID=1892477 RepID=A0ABP0DR39_9PEZI